MDFRRVKIRKWSLFLQIDCRREWREIRIGKKIGPIEITQEAEFLKIIYSGGLNRIKLDPLPDNAHF